MCGCNAHDKLVETTKNKSRQEAKARWSNANAKMKMANIRSKERYYRKMVLDGYVIRTDFSDVREMIRLLSNSSNNLNQISKWVNSTGSIYADDIKDIKDNYELLWGQVHTMLKKFTKLPD